jgi:superfamily II DNA or RNA helicase
MKKPVSKKIVFQLSPEYKEIIRTSSYIGKKGYTVPKSILLPNDLEFLKQDLFMKPQTFGFSGIDNSNAFAVYRENDNKIYLPRFYGINRYGMPNKSEIDPGNDIDIQFVKELRDYQTNIIKIYLNHISSGSNGGILEVPCGRGKCLGKDTPILMYDGSIKLVQDIIIGDLLMGDDSKPRKVLTLARGREMMYKIESTNEETYIVNESHILSLKYGKNMNKNTPKNSVLDISVLDYLKLPEYYHGKESPLYGYKVPVHFQDKDIEIDAYSFGYWLGADSSNENEINNSKTFMNFLKKYDIINDKHIPHHYKSNSRIKQLELLAGLIDSNGFYDNNYYKIIQKNQKIVDDIIYISRSLGFAAFKNEFIKKESKELYYFINIYGKKLYQIPVKCLEKKATEKEISDDYLKYHISVKPIGIDDYYGFEIDGNRRFLLGDYTVTHNTVMALKILSELKKKTLILVHKEFLMNQWIERIGEFLPSARVGKIQCSKFEIEGNDIVIGMIQTIYSRQFPITAFQCFGLTIIDEVHHIGSEEFSKTLLKIVTPYMLGISATVERKDGLTRILNMFIGDKIYSEERSSDDPVCVRGIVFHSEDPEFNETIYDWKGNTQYSSMITKICEFGPRSDFIVRVLKDLILENPENQIMVLAHNRSLLTYLYEAINHQGISTTGYYIGGMKEAKLKETETKQIVLATYAMAAEALDIKTLSTLVMVTSKTDIEQSVGRILRIRHKNPIVVDIIDRHESFMNQWTKRKTFYRKCNYKISMIDSIKYNGFTDVGNWKILYQPKIANIIEKDKEEIPIIPTKCLLKLPEGLKK